jgi:hypothetical protein
MSLQKGSGAWLGLLLPLFLVPMIFNLTQMIRKKDERKTRGTRIAIWSLALALTCIVQTYWSKASHNEAEITLKKIRIYKEHTGNYPDSLREVGLDDRQLMDTWMIRYVVDKGKVSFTYPKPFMPMAMYEYDFEACKWRENVY